MQNREDEIECNYDAENSYGVIWLYHRTVLNVF